MARKKFLTVFLTVDVEAERTAEKTTVRLNCRHDGGFLKHAASPVAAARSYRRSANSYLSNFQENGGVNFI